MALIQLFQSIIQILTDYIAVNRSSCDAAVAKLFLYQAQVVIRGLVQIRGIGVAQGMYGVVF